MELLPTVVDHFFFASSKTWLSDAFPVFVLSTAVHTRPVIQVVAVYFPLAQRVTAAYVCVPVSTFKSPPLTPFSYYIQLSHHKHIYTPVSLYFFIRSKAQEGEINLLS